MTVSELTVGVTQRTAVAVLAGALAAGWVHPVAWVAGYSALPLAVVLQGLRLAREESRA